MSSPWLKFASSPLSVSSSYTSSRSYGTSFGASPYGSGSLNLNSEDAVYRVPAPKPVASINLLHSVEERNENAPLTKSGNFPSYLSTTSTGSDEPPLLGDDDVKKSSWLQSCFNTINVLMGVGMISLPYAVRVAGWGPGMFFIGFFSVACNYTARTLIYCMRMYGLESYADIGARAFGKKGRLFTTIIIFCELFTASVMYIIVAGDNLAKLYPSIKTEHFMIFTACVMLPTVWLRQLKFLSYLSVMGLFTMTFLLSVVITEGVLGASAVPGSLVHPPPTQLTSWSTSPYAIGMVMCGFAGHPVIPTIYNDMRQPRRFSSMLNCSFFVVASFYTTMAVVGYFMYGDKCTEHEITLNLSSGPLTNTSLWLVVIVPVLKFALTLSPVVLTLEQLYKDFFMPRTFIVVSTVVRSIVVGMTLLFAIYIPYFDRVMGFCGSFFSFNMSVVFPAACYLKLFWPRMRVWAKVVNIGLVIWGLTCIVLGTGGVIFVDVPRPIASECVPTPYNASLHMEL